MYVFFFFAQVWVDPFNSEVSGFSLSVCISQSVSQSVRIRNPAWKAASSSSYETCSPKSPEEELGLLSLNTH